MIFLTIQIKLSLILKKNLTYDIYHIGCHKMTLATAQEFYEAAKLAYKKALEAQSYSISSGGASRSLTNQDLEKLLSNMLYWEQEVASLSGSGSSNSRVKFGTVKNG